MSNLIERRDRVVGLPAWCEDMPKLSEEELKRVGKTAWDLFTSTTKGQYWKVQCNMSNLKDEIAETLYDFNVQSDVTVEELADMIADIFKKHKDGEPYE